MKQEYSFEHDPKLAFKSYLSNTRKELESELKKLISDLSELSLQPQIEYAVLSQGKRLRPLLVILSAESVGGNRSKVMSLALAFELMHTATLIHDDIIDEDDTRRDRPALHRKWSVNDAILTGDALIALSIDLASGYDQTIIKTVARSALELCEGEHADITLSLEKTDEEAYFKRIRQKSASLFRAAAYCGALAGGGTSSQAQFLSDFGENLGVAYQIRDDVLDLAHRGNFMLRDLKSGRATLPLIYAYAASNQQQKTKLKRQLQALMNVASTSSDKTVKDLLQAINQTGALEYCERKIEDHLRLAVSSVGSLRDSEYRTYLIQMARLLKTMS